jgi:hydrogenase/urease accessory protein HupE
VNCIRQLKIANCQFLIFNCAMTRAHKLLLAAGIFAVAPLVAQAHTGQASFDGWHNGFSHPFQGWDHLVAMLAVGLWAAQQRGPALWRIPLTFVAMMGVGGLVGVTGAHVPGVEAAILLSVAVFGVLVARRIRLGTGVTMLLVGFFAFFHGFAHGQEMPGSASLVTFALGFIFATIILHALGLLTGRVAAVALACLVGGASPKPACAQGGSPLLTEDPYTPGHNTWEINLAGAMERRGRTWTWEAPILDINYGWRDRTQFKFEIPYAIEDHDRAGPQGGVGNAALGVKWRFLDEDRHGVAMAITPQFEFSTEQSSRRRGLATENKSLLLPVEMSRGFGPNSVNLEVGYALVEEESDEWIYGLAFGHQVTDRLQLLAEVYGIADQDLAEHQVVFQLGARKVLTKNLSLLIAGGRGIVSPADEEIKALGYVALQIRF